MAKKRTFTGKDSSRRIQERAKSDATLPVGPPLSELPSDYAPLLADLKQRIATERVKTVLAANAAMVQESLAQILFPHRQERYSAATSRRSGALFCLFSKEVNHG